ncbi:MAG: transposase [Egibacteraceae bacterium]
MVAQARAADRGRAATPDEPLTVDLDATLIIAHSDDKDGPGKTYKKTWGHHPLNAYLGLGDGLGESLVGLLRPGNAGANTAADHISVFEAAIDQLPALPDRLDRLDRLVRTDTAEASHDFLDHIVGHNHGWRFSVGFPLGDRVKTAIRSLTEPGWTAATRQDATLRAGAAVAEITHNDHIDLTGWPARSRLIVRREPLPSPRPSPSTRLNCDPRNPNSCVTRSCTPPPGSSATPAASASTSNRAGPGPTNSWTRSPACSPYPSPPADPPAPLLDNPHTDPLSDVPDVAHSPAPTPPRPPPINRRTSPSPAP